MKELIQDQYNTLKPCDQASILILISFRVEMVVNLYKKTVSAVTWDCVAAHVKTHQTGRKQQGVHCRSLYVCTLVNFL